MYPASWIIVWGAGWGARIAIVDEDMGKHSSRIRVNSSQIHVCLARVGVEAIGQVKDGDKRVDGAKRGDGDARGASCLEFPSFVSITRTSNYLHVRPVWSNKG